MICPLCGEEINKLEVVEQVITFLKYVISKDGISDEKYREGDEEAIRCFAKLPCCGGVIDIKTWDTAEELVLDDAILVPEDNCPDSVTVEGRHIYCIKYKGELYAHTHLLPSVEVFESEHEMWTEGLGYTCLIFYKWDVFLNTWINPDDKAIRSSILKKRLEQCSPELHDKDLLLER